MLIAALSTLWVGLFPGIVASDAVGGAATGRSCQLTVGGSAECRHHMIARGRGTDKGETEWRVVARTFLRHAVEAIKTPSPV